MRRLWSLRAQSSWVGFEIRPARVLPLASGSAALWCGAATGIMQREGGICHDRDAARVEIPGAQTRVELPAAVHQRETHLGVDSLLRIHEREGTQNAATARRGLRRAPGSG